MKETPEEFQRVREAALFIRNIPAGKVLFEYLAKRLEHHKDVMLTLSGDDLLRTQGNAREVKQILEELHKSPPKKKE